MIATLTLLAVSALALPTLVHYLHTPAAGHEDLFSIACAVVLLVVFIASLPVSLKGGPTNLSEEPGELEGSTGAVSLWPVWFAVVVLIGAAVGSVFVSDWFVTALTPAITALHINAGSATP
jgi:Ca2+:H+ antiporter